MIFWIRIDESLEYAIEARTLVFNVKKQPNYTYRKLTEHEVKIVLQSIYK